MEELRHLLVSSVEDIIFIDRNIDHSKLKKNQKRLLKDWSNPNYFENLLVINRSKFNRERRTLRHIQKEFSSVPITETLQLCISHKWSELIKQDQEKCTKLTTCFNNKWGDDSNQINRSSSLLIQYSRRCLISGKNISDQRKGSKFTSVKKIGYYPAHNLRNKDSNPRNNLRKRLTKITNAGPTLFDLNEVIKLNPDQKKSLDYWKGSKFEITELH